MIINYLKGDRMSNPDETHFQRGLESRAKERTPTSNRVLGVITKSVKLERRAWLALEVIWRMDGYVSLGEWFNALVASVVRARMNDPDWQKELLDWSEETQEDLERIQQQVRDTAGFKGFKDDDAWRRLWSDLIPGYHQKGGPLQRIREARAAKIKAAKESPGWVKQPGHWCHCGAEADMSANGLGYCTQHMPGSPGRDPDADLARIDAIDKYLSTLS